MHPRLRDINSALHSTRTAITNLETAIDKSNNDAAPELTTALDNARSAETTLHELTLNFRTIYRKKHPIITLFILLLLWSALALCPVVFSWYEEHEWQIHSMLRDPYSLLYIMICLPVAMFVYACAGWAADYLRRLLHLKPH